MGKENETPEETGSGEDVFDAVNAAVDDATYADEDTANENGNADESSEQDVSGDDSERSGVSDDGESTDSAGEEDEQGESGESEDEDAGESSEDGESEGDDEAATPDGGEGADDEDGGDEGAGEGDHVNDPIPEGTNERTASRIQSLISDVKELSIARDERDEILSAIERVGATPDQYAGALTVIGLFNSDSVDDKRQALEIIRGMERDLALQTGDARNHIKLSDYPDLEAEVEAGQLTEERALELANVRATEQHRKTLNEQRTQQQNEQQESQQAVERGKQELNKLGGELRNDPAYTVLYPQFTSILNATLRRLPAAEWRDAAAEVWQQLKAANPDAGKTAPAAQPPSGKRKAEGDNTPLRPKSGSSSGNKQSEASSALEAMDEALGGI